MPLHFRQPLTMTQIPDILMVLPASQKFAFGHLPIQSMQHARSLLPLKVPCPSSFFPAHDHAAATALQLCSMTPEAVAFAVQFHKATMVIGSFNSARGSECMLPVHWPFAHAATLVPSQIQHITEQSRRSNASCSISPGCAIQLLQMDYKVLTIFTCKQLL